MYELAEVGDLPLPQPSPQPSHKRDRDSTKAPTSDSVDSSPSPASEPRHFAGSKRVGEARARQTSRSASSLSPTPVQPSQPSEAQPASVQQSTIYNGTASIVEPALPTVEPMAQPIVVPLNDGSSYGNRNLYTADTPAYASGSSTGPTGPALVNGMQPQAAQPLGMDPMVSMQSMMYDQVLHNLSASLMQPASSAASQPPTQSTGPQFVHPPDENLDEWLRMASLGADAFMPDAPENLAQSMWSAAPNGFECVFAFSS